MFGIIVTMFVRYCIMFVGYTLIKQYKAVAGTLKGGGVVYSYINVLADECLFKLSNLNLTL